MVSESVSENRGRRNWAFAEKMEYPQKVDCEREMTTHHIMTI